jgi:DNA-binding NarL/FixJ family response regulator
MGLVFLFVCQEQAAHFSLDIFGSSAEVEVFAGDELPAAPTQDPQVIVLDTLSAGKDHSSLLLKLQQRWKDVPVLLVSDLEDINAVRAALDAGVSGYMLRSQAAKQMVRALAWIQEGDPYLDPVILRCILAPDEHRPQLPATITRREQEVLHYLLKGLTYKQIAGHCFISVDTLNSHIRHIYSKFKVHSKAELISKYRYNHLQLTKI